MSEPRNDADLDALAPAAKRVKLGGKVYRLPGDMPLPLFFRVQRFEQRIEAGEDEVGMLSELAEELLALFQVHQPALKELPSMGVLTLMASLGAIYSGGGAGGEAQTDTTPRPRKRTPSKPAGRRPPRTSR